MSFWGGDETIYVSSVIYPIGDEIDKIPDVVKASIIGAAMKNRSKPMAIKRSIIDGLGVKLIQAYNYAARSYYAGLPDGIPQVIGETSNDTVTMLLTDYLTALHAPSAITLMSCEVRTTTQYDTVLRNQIETKYNYDFYDEGVYTSVFGIPVDSTLAYEALPPDDTLYPDKDGWRLTFTKPDTTTVSFDEWYDQTLFPEVDLVENRILYEVSIAGAPAVSGCYSYGDGNSRLNLFLKTLVTKQKTTFPAIVLKKNNQYLNTNRFYDKLTHPADWWKDQPAYKTSKVYARRMGVQMDDLLDLIKNNPDQGKIDYAFIQPGTIISSPNLCAAEYHFNYFNALRLRFPDGKPAYDAWLAKTGATMEKSEAKRCPSQSVHIVDPDDTKNTVNMTIAWRYMTYEVKTGTLAKPYVVECGPQARKTVLFHWKGANKNVKYDFCKLYLRKRLTDTTYAELMVCGLWHENYVYKGKTVKSGVWDAFNDPEGDYGTGFLIPLDYEIYISLSARERLQLAQEGLHIVFNCYKVVKEKWYQTGIFKVVLIIISIVVIVITWGAASPYVAALNSAIYGSLVAVGIGVTVAAALAAILTALILVAVMVAVQLVAKEAGEWAAEHWGPVWGAIVQVVVTIVLTWGIGQIGSAYLGVTMTPMTLTQQFMFAASTIFSTLSTYTQYAMEEIQKEAKQFQDLVDDPNNPQKMLEQLWEENFPEMSLPAQMWFAPMEKMDDWLTRTLSSGDTLVQRLTAPIEYMSEITLTPRLQ
jgi:hypothetical protein